MVKTTLGLASLVFLAQACSNGVTPDASTPQARVIKPFTAWCADWQLTCPTGAAPDMPSEGSPWTPEQWRSLMGAVRALTHDQVDVVVTRQELEDPDLVQAADLVGAGRLFASFKKLISDTGLSDARIGGGKVGLSFTGSGARQGVSGLQVRYEPATSLSVEEDRSIAVSGVAIESGHAARESVTGVAFTGKNIVDWKYPSGSKVIDAPIKFVFDEVVGVDFAVDSDVDPEYAEIVKALGTLERWIKSGRREVALSRPTFEALEANLPALFDEPRHKNTVKYLFGRLVKLSSHEATRAQRLATGEASASISCALRGRAEITTSRNFSVDSMEPLRSGGVRLRFTGVSARPLRGLIRPTLSMRTLDLEPTKIVIHDVPVLGTYAIRMDDPSDDEPFEVTCGG